MKWWMISSPSHYYDIVPAGTPWWEKCCLLCPTSQITASQRNGFIFWQRKNEKDKLAYFLNQVEHTWWAMGSFLLTVDSWNLLMMLLCFSLHPLLIKGSITELLKITLSQILWWPHSLIMPRSCMVGLAHGISKHCGVQVIIYQS